MADVSHIFFCTPVALADELQALLVQPLQRLEFIVLLSRPVLPQLLLQQVQLTLPPLLNLPADLQGDVPLLLSNLDVEANVII